MADIFATSNLFGIQENEKPNHIDETSFNENVENSDCLPIGIEFIQFATDIQETTSMIINDQINLTKQMFLSEVSKEEIKQKIDKYTVMIKEFIERGIDTIIKTITSFRDQYSPLIKTAKENKNTLQSMKNSSIVEIDENSLNPLTGYPKLNISLLKNYIDKEVSKFNHDIYNSDVIVEKLDAAELYKTIHKTVFGYREENIWKETTPSKWINTNKEIADMLTSHIHTMNQVRINKLKATAKSIKPDEEIVKSPDKLNTFKKNLSLSTRNAIAVMHIEKQICLDVYKEFIRVSNVIIRAAKTSVNENSDYLDNIYNENTEPSFMEMEDSIIESLFDGIIAESLESLEEAVPAIYHGDVTPQQKNKLIQFAESVKTFIITMCNAITKGVKDFIKTLKEKLKSKTRQEWVEAQLKHINPCPVNNFIVYSRPKLIDGFFTINEILTQGKSEIGKINFKLDGYDIYDLFENKSVSDEQVHDMLTSFDKDYVFNECMRILHPVQGKTLKSNNPHEFATGLFGPTAELSISKSYIQDTARYYSQLASSVESFDKVAMPKINEVNNEIKNINDRIKQLKNVSIKGSNYRREMDCLNLILAYNKSIYSYFTFLVKLVANGIQIFETTAKRAIAMWAAGAYAVEKGYDAANFIKSKFQSK